MIGVRAFDRGTQASSVEPEPPPREEIRIPFEREVVHGDDQALTSADRWHGCVVRRVDDVVIGKC